MKRMKKFILFLFCFMFIFIPLKIEASEDEPSETHKTEEDLRTDMIDNLSIEELDQHWQQLYHDYGDFLTEVPKKSIKEMIQLLQTIGEKASIESTYIQTILKIIGIAYVTELGANIVKDAGLASVASKLELAGKIFILLLAIPIITAVIDIVIQFIPTNSSYLQ